MAVDKGGQMAVDRGLRQDAVNLVQQLPRASFPPSDDNIVTSYNDQFLLFLKSFFDISLKLD